MKTLQQLSDAELSRRLSEARDLFWGDPDDFDAGNFTAIRLIEDEQAARRLARFERASRIRWIGIAACAVIYLVVLVLKRLQVVT